MPENGFKKISNIIRVIVKQFSQKSLAFKSASFIEKALENIHNQVTLSIK